MGDLLNLVNGLRAGEMNYQDFIGGLGQWFNDIGVGEKVTSFMELAWFPFLALGVGALLLFYGKKWLGLLKFLVCGAAGFVVGLVVNPMLVGMLPFLDGKAWITASLCALILAVLNKLIYGIIFFGGSAAGAFALFYFEGILPMELPTVGNPLLCLIPAGITILLMLMIRKNVQRLVTATIGAFILNLGIKKLYDYTATIPEQAMFVDLGVVAFFVLVGFIYQYRRRRRYS